METQPGAGSGIHGRVLPLLNRLDRGLGKNRVAPDYGRGFNGSARGDDCIHTHVTANAYTLQIRRVFGLNPVNKFPLVIVGLSP